MGRVLHRWGGYHTDGAGITRWGGYYTDGAGITQMGWVLHRWGGYYTGRNKGPKQPQRRLSRSRQKYYTRWGGYYTDGAGITQMGAGFTHMGVTETTFSIIFSSLFQEKSFFRRLSLRIEQINFFRKQNLFVELILIFREDPVCSNTSHFQEILVCFLVEFLLFHRTHTIF